MPQAFVHLHLHSEFSLLDSTLRLKPLVERAKESNAKGVIGFTLKFCDPYLARIPMIRQALQKESIPFLMLEGDCTTGSMGQQQTRIEAFTEMLGV